MSNRNNKFQFIASNLASKSTIKNKHGSIITRGNKIYAIGYNNPRTKFLKKYDYCQHAEMAAISQFINKYIKCKSNKFSRNKYKKIYSVIGNKEVCDHYNLKKFTVWCVRLSKSNSKKNLMSAPCLICLKRMTNLGFGKIAFSNNEGNIEIHKLNNYNTKHLSSAYR